MVPRVFCGTLQVFQTTLVMNNESPFLLPLLCSYVVFLMYRVSTGLKNPDDVVSNTVSFPK
jgi:hypothetical protein